MKKMTKSLVATAILAAGTMTGGAALAMDGELSANVGAVTNYVDRGLTMSDDKFAVQGGVDFNMDTGVHLNAWGSTYDTGATDGLQIDLVAGFANEVGDIAYDAGVKHTLYTDSNDDSANEVFLTGSMDIYSAGLYLGENDAKYIEFGVEMADMLPEDIVLNVHLGRELEAEVTDFGVGISKDFEGFNVSANVTNSDAATVGETKFWLGVSKGFEL